MSAIFELEESLQTYWQMPHHRDPALMSCLVAVQNWQKKRMRGTHEQLFSQANHQQLAEYFLNRLYGGDEFEVLARQLERMLPKAKKVEKIVPNNAIETGNFGIRLAVLAVQLDEEVAHFLLQEKLDVSENNMFEAYHACDQKQDREYQMELLSKLCYRLDKYVRSFMLKKAFDLSKGTAYNHGFNALYDFLDEGFSAMKPIQSMEKFIEPFCSAELQLIKQVHERQAHPFVLQKSN